MDASVAFYDEFYAGAQGDSVFHKLLAAAMGAGWPEGSEQYSYLDRNALDWISSVLATVSGHGDIVDLGCGNGWLTTQMSRRSVRSLIGIDRSEGAIRTAAHRKDPADTRFLVGSFSQLPLQSSSIIAAVSLDSVQHAAELPRFVAELSRVCRNDAVLLFTSWTYREAIHALQKRHSLCRSMLPAGFRLCETRDLDPDLQMQFRLYSYAKANREALIAAHGAAFFESLMEEAMRLVPVRGEVAHMGLVFRFYGRSFG